MIESSVYLGLVVQICKLIYMGNTPQHTRKKLAHPGFDPCSNLNFGVKFEWAALHAHAHYKHTGEVNRPTVPHSETRVTLWVAFHRLRRRHRPLCSAA